MHDTKNSLPPATRQKVETILNQLLADLSDLYSQTKQAHWNVRGKWFIMLHKLFDDLAEEVLELIDPLAERITALGGTAQGTARQAAKNSALPEFPTEQKDDHSFVAALVERFATTANAARKAIDQAEDLGDRVTADLLNGVTEELDKGLWFLEAHNVK